MSSTDPFGDGDSSNPFFETVKVQSPINEDAVFGGSSADGPAPGSGGGRAPMPDMAVPDGAFSSATGSSSNSALLFAGDDSDETKPINFDDEQAKAAGRAPESQDASFTDKAVSGAADVLFEGNEEDDTPNQQGGKKKEKRRWYHFWRPSFYRPYFDVDSKDVFVRCFAGIVPFGKSFFDRVQGNPDLYGPFWVTTTVLFLLAIASNFSEYIAFAQNDVADKYEANFYKVSIAAAVFYAFLIGVPLIVWALQRFLAKAKLTLFQIICVYGYSMTSFLIATPFCIFPNEWVRWLVIIVACVISCACNTVALYKALKHDTAKGLVVIILVIVFQMALSLTYKLYFFAEIDVPEHEDSSK